MKFDKLFCKWEDAVALKSADKAIILEFIRWSCHFKESESEPNPKYYIDGVWWMQDSHEAWRKRMPWLSEKTIRRHLDELCELGYIAKKQMGSTQGGRVPNFYRPLDKSEEPTETVSEVVGQNDQQGLLDNLTRVVGHFDQGLLDNLTSTSLSKNHTKNHTYNQRRLKSVPKPKINTWKPDDPLADVFTNLNKLAVCRAKFETEDYREYITGMMTQYSLTLADMVRLSYEWQEANNDKNEKDRPKSPKSSFRTWARNNFNGDKRNGNSKRSSPRVDYSANTVADFNAYREDKPWLKI